MAQAQLGWFGIVRLGLVQTALGAIVVLTTSTMNRVMVVELALPAMLPGALVALHHAVQLLRPRWGHGSDVGGRRTPWIIGGMAILAAGGTGAALAIALMEYNATLGIAAAVLAFFLIGIGVGACGTSLLVLLAKRVDPERRAPAATIVWVMMIAGFIVTAGTVGHLLDPFTTSRLVFITAAVSALAFLIACIAVWGVEGTSGDREQVAKEAGSHKPAFRAALAQVSAEPAARNFTIFVFLSMFAYSAQDLILEPFAGTVFGFTPGESTKLAGMQNSGVLLGMLLVPLITKILGPALSPSLRGWTIGGCIASAVALGSLAIGGLIGGSWPLTGSVFLLGLANGAFAVAAIGSMMALASDGKTNREGVRMGLWGAAQAIGFGAGGFAGAMLADAFRLVTDSAVHGYVTVFALEALLFVVAAGLACAAGDAWRGPDGRTLDARPRMTAIGRNFASEAAE